MLLVALTVPGLLPGLLPAQASGPASCLHPDRRRSRASKAAAAAAAARPSPDGPVTFRAADAAAEAGLAVADALRADGVVRVDGILTREMAAEDAQGGELASALAKCLPAVLQVGAF